MPSNRRAAVIGVGMIGGSLAVALKTRGWHVTVNDIDQERAEEAVARGIADVAGVGQDVEITFVATPVSSVVDAAEAALARGGVVTDVGSVKGTVVDQLTNERFVGGHPMAGSERSGLDGVDPELFEGATWVLTPAATTSPEAYLVVRNVVAELGASVITLDADEHDEMVATISHVPHFAAAALMTVALQRAHEHDILLRLAAGGFRDMTRIAAGHPALWTDIALENRDAIVDGLGRLTTSLDELREFIANSDREQLQKLLAVASEARKELPLRTGRPEQLAVLSIPIPDRPGALGEVLGTFGEIRVNVEDLEIAHDPKGDRGTLQITIAAAAVDAARESLHERGFRVAVEVI